MGVMGTTVKTLYETDFVEWAARTAELLRARRFDEIDIDNVAEEIDYLARRERHAVRAQLRRVLVHLLKMRIQPERSGASWRTSVLNAQEKILDAIEDSPSLRRYLQEGIEEIYRRAVKFALDETNLTERAPSLGIPPRCPYTLTELLESDLNELSGR
jgi:Domain of unknown function DUF29